MARSFMMIPQICAAIIKAEGRNEFLRGKGGMHFNISKLFTPSEDGCGVLIVDDPQTVPSVSSISGLKHEIPKIKHEWMKYLKKGEINLLHDKMAIGNMSEDVLNCWTQFFMEDMDEDEFDDEIDAFRYFRNSNSIRRK